MVWILFRIDNDNKNINSKSGDRKKVWKCYSLIEIVHMLDELSSADDLNDSNDLDYNPTDAEPDLHEGTSNVVDVYREDSDGESENESDNILHGVSAIISESDIDTYCDDSVRYFLNEGNSGGSSTINENDDDNDNNDDEDNDDNDDWSRNVKAKVPDLFQPFATGIFYTRLDHTSSFLDFFNLFFNYTFFIYLLNKQIFMHSNAVMQLWLLESR